MLLDAEVLLEVGVGISEVLAGGGTVARTGTGTLIVLAAAITGILGEALAGGIATLVLEGTRAIRRDSVLVFGA